MSHIGGDEEKSIGFSSPPSTNAAPPSPSLGEAAAVTAKQQRAKIGAAAAAVLPGPRALRLGSDAAGSASGSLKGKVSCCTHFSFSVILRVREEHGLARLREIVLLTTF